MKQEIVNLLSSCKGIEVNFFDQLSLRPMEDGRWRVLNQPQTFIPLEKGEKHIFDNLEEAADKFHEIAQSRQLCIA